ncbi:MAG: GAF domain-containing protein, partial [Acidobacteriota bacterium]
MTDSRPVALLAGLDLPLPRHQELLGAVRVLEVAAAEAHDVLAAETIDILALGPGLTGQAGLDFLAEAFPSPDEYLPRILVFSAGAQPEIYFPWIHRGLLFFLSAEPPTREAIVRLLESAASRSLQGVEPLSEAETQDLLGLAKRLKTAEDVAALSTAVSASIPMYSNAERGACWIYEAAGELLWRQQPHGGIDRASAAVGLVSFVQRTGEPTVIESLDEDPRHDLDIDDPDRNADPDGGPREAPRFLGVPVRGQSGSVLAVLVAIRAKTSPRFSDRDVLRLSRLAAQLTSPLELHALATSSSVGNSRGTNDMEKGSQLFRQRAMAHHARGQEGQGRLL